MASYQKNTEREENAGINCLCSVEYGAQLRSVISENVSKH